MGLLLDEEQRQFSSFQHRKKKKKKKKKKTPYQLFSTLRFCLGGGEGLKSLHRARGAWGLEGYEAMGLRVWRCVVDDGDDVGRVEGLQRRGGYLRGFRVSSLGPKVWAAGLGSRELERLPAVTH